MQWKHDRILTFVMGPWSGWFCQRCCWHRRLPSDFGQRDILARTIEEEFQAHSCEQYAQQTWQNPGSMTSSKEA